MSETTLGTDKAGSGLRQWGSDWFFKKDGNKSSLNTSTIAWTGAVGVALFSAVQFTDTNSASSAAGPKSEQVGLSAMTTPAPDFPIAEERPFDDSPKARPTNSGGRAVKLAGPQLVARPRNLAAIPPGSLLKATLVSGASNGLAKAQLEEPLVVNGDILIENGAILVGQGSSADERLMVTFSQVVFRDGSFGNIQAQACDASDQIVGLKGSKVGNKAINIAGSVGLGFVGGLAEGFQDTQGQQGATVRPPSRRNALLNATATTALEQSRNLMSDLKERKPVIEVPAGTGICVLFGGGQ
jgi:fluoride ion exporter CrcB/FEX